MKIKATKETASVHLPTEQASYSYMEARRNTHVGMYTMRHHIWRRKGKRKGV